jgi:hypothetical protein
MNNKNVNNDPIKGMIGQIVFCTKISGKPFSARLVAVHNDELWFEIRDGKRMMDRRQSIATISPYIPTWMQREGITAVD